MLMTSSYLMKLLQNLLLKIVLTNGETLIRSLRHASLVKHPWLDCHWALLKMRMGCLVNLREPNLAVLSIGHS